MQKDWVKVYTSRDFYKAELVRHVLIEHEIEAILVNKQGFPYNFGDVEIYIHQLDFDKAIEIIIRQEL